MVGTHQPRHRTSRHGKSTYFGQYVSFEGSKQLKTYQYHGCDHSYIYKYMLSPMNSWLIEFIPLSVAPNMITLFGLILVLITHGIMVYYCPDLQGEAPSWTYVLCAVALFGYQTLDNLDGKQARRTGTSSPLGLLFDHGCDAINVTVGCLTMACVMNMGPGWKSLTLFLIGNSTFVFATWEEYYTGSLQLPFINGPTEGILIGVFLKLLSGVIGSAFWLEESFPGIQNNTIFLAITTLTGILTIFSNIYNVFKGVQRHNDSMWVAITRLLPFVVLNGAATAWALWSPSKIMAEHSRMFIWTLGLLHSKLVLHLMLAHLCGEEYHPFRKTLVPIVYVAAHWAFCSYRGIYHELDELLVLNEFFFISLIAYVHLVVSVVIEVSDVLQIPIFTIPKSKSK